MAQFSMLDRLKSMLYPLVQQNAVSEAMLTGPALELGQLEGAADLMQYDGRFMDPNTVRIEADLVTLTQVASVDRVEGQTTVYAPLADWTIRYRTGDEVIVGGSSKGNNGRRVIQTVTKVGNNYQMTVAAPFVAAEDGLIYGKPTYELLNRCRELLLYPGGYETDTQLRALLVQWLTTMQRRGSVTGIKAEMNRVTNNTTTEVLQTIPALETLVANASYTHSTQSVPAGSWSSDLVPGSTLSVVGSSLDSNGRYTVYSADNTRVVLGHRARASQRYAEMAFANATELQFREDRVLNRLWVRLHNTTGSSKTVGFTVTVTGSPVGTAAVATGTGTVSVSNGVATVSLTAGAGSLATPTIAEVVLPLTNANSAVLQVTITAGTPTAVRLGAMGLCPNTPAGTPDLAALWTWRWGGIVKTGLRSARNETGITLLGSTKPGFYVGVTCPESVEEDAYTMGSPDEFVVVEVDHRNPANYTTQDLGTLVRDVLLPADVTGILGTL